MGRSPAYRVTGLILLLALLTPAYMVVILPYSTVNAQAPQTSPIPPITAGVSEIISANIGPVVPAIVAPGESFTLELRPEYSGLALSAGYVWTVKLSGGKLTILNYTVTLSPIATGVYRITVPESVEEGLYDLVLVGQGQYTIPRSVWVVENWPSTLRFIENTDIHFIAGQPDPFMGDVCRFSGFTIDNLLNPHFIFWLGDIGENVATSEYKMTYAYRYAYLYSIPVLGIPGNHDYSAAGSPYPKYLGPTRWFRLLANGRVLVIGLWTYEQGYPRWEDLVFAEQVLGNYSSVPYKIILVHHPPLYYQGELYTWYNDTVTLKPYVPGGPSTPVSSYWSNNMTALRYFLKLLEDYNVTLVLAGHTHRDFFVKYTSTRTNTTTLLLTFTTMAMGTASYPGLSLMEFDLDRGVLDFPLKPPTFMGFQNSSRALALNSIPIGIYPVTNSLGWSNLNFTYMNVIYSASGYKFILINNNLSWINLTGTVLWSLPWSGSSVHFKILRSVNSALASLVDYLITGNRLFIALNLTIPYKGGVEFILYSAEDSEPPAARIAKTMPELPLVNRDVKIIVELSDAGLGVDPLKIELKLGGISVVPSTIPLNWTYTISPQTYTEQFNTITLTITANVKANQNTTLPLEVVVYDNAGNSAVYAFNITFIAPVKTTTTPTTPATQPTQTQTTTTSPVESSTSIETTTAPSTTPPSQTSPSASTPPVQTSPTPVAPVTTITAPPPPLSATPATQLVILAIAVIAVIVIIIVAVLLARK